MTKSGPFSPKVDPKPTQKSRKLQTKRVSDFDSWKSLNSFHKLVKGIGGGSDTFFQIS